MSLATSPITKAATERFLTRILKCFEPRVPQAIDEWVAENVFFNQKISSFPGYWSHAHFPYSREPLTTLTKQDTEIVVLKFGTQLGKTAMLGAHVAWVTDQTPQPLMITCPEEQSAQEHQKLKLIPMLELVEKIKPKLQPVHKRKNERVDLGDQIIYYGWSGARWTVSGRSAAVVYVTEINLHTRNKSAEGDPVEMALDRTKGFADWKVLVEGKPSVTGECRITKYWEQSDQRTYQLPCPHCKVYQPLILGSKDSVAGFKFKLQPNGELIDESVFYQCAHCQQPIQDKHKPLMLLNGVWCPKGQTVEPETKRLLGIADRRPRIAGFHLGSQYSNVIRWAQFVRKFLENKRSTIESFKNFVQGWLAEAWEERTRKTDESELENHRGSYQLGIVPAGALKLILTVDVQETHLWYVLRAWGYNASSWLIRYGALIDFVALKAMFGNAYAGLDGGTWRISDCWIDSGYRTPEVYEFCRQNRCVPIKGDKQYRQARFLSPLSITKEFSGWLIDKGQACDELYDRRLAIKRGDPGFWEFAADTGDDYIRSMMSYERKEEKDKTGKKKFVWVSVSPEYEHWADCDQYQVAAAHHYQFADMHPPDGPARKPATIEPVKRRDGRDWWQR